MNELMKIGKLLVEKYGDIVGYVAIGLLVVSVILFSYGSYVFARWINWELSYESNVRTMICESVKPEFLNPNACGKE